MFFYVLVVKSCFIKIQNGLPFWCRFTQILQLCLQYLNIVVAVQDENFIDCNCKLSDSLELISCSIKHLSVMILVVDEERMLLVLYVSISALILWAG